MRLIDADALIEKLREIKTLYGVPITKRDEQMVHWVIGHINNQPTAYDVEKVVEELEDLDILISDFLVPLQIENVCEELSDWDLDEDCETWCSRNCGVTNDGKCPAMNCYKEWIKMKRWCKY